MILCPTCNSARIGTFRLDSDWGDGGDWYAANDAAEAEYTDQDCISFDNNERPDIECHVCCECSTCF